MIVDTSAILAILFDEIDASQYAQAIATTDVCKMSAANWLEAAIDVDHRGPPTAGRDLDILIDRAQIAIEPVTLEQVQIARQAYIDYGKGRHPAGLNFGDAFAYALAKFTGEPLLFKGNDFPQTDIEAVPLNRLELE